VQPQPGHTGLPSVSGQRSRRNTFSTPRSDMRMILAALSERAAADRRKCCAMRTDWRKPTVLFLPGSVAEYKPDFAGGGCYMIPHHLVEPVACTPASGWEKGQVENQVG